MPYSVKGFFEIDEDMVQILLVLEVLFTQDSEVEDLYCGASSLALKNLRNEIPVMLQVEGPLPWVGRTRVRKKTF